MAKSQYGVLILEGNWAEDGGNYLTDSRSTSKLYTALEDILSLEQNPIKFIQRPLLNSRFIEDIKQFTSLTKNQHGGTVIILSAHGKRIKTREGKKRRVLKAIDGKLNLSLQIKGVGKILGKTIIVLDSCEIGGGLNAFQKVANALAVVGFRESVGWVDSALFVLAFLDKLNNYEYFSKKSEIEVAAKKAIEAMWEPSYGVLADYLGAKKVIWGKMGDRSRYGATLHDEAC